MPLESTFSVNVYGISEQDAEQKALNEVTQMLEATRDSSKDFPVLLPANNLSEQREKLAVLVSTGKSNEALGIQVSFEHTSRTKMWRNLQTI